MSRDVKIMIDAVEKTGRKQMREIGIFLLVTLVVLCPLNTSAMQLLYAPNQGTLNGSLSTPKATRNHNADPCVYAEKAGWLRGDSDLLVLISPVKSKVEIFRVGALDTEPLDQRIAKEKLRELLKRPLVSNGEIHIERATCGTGIRIYVELTIKSPD